MEVYEFFGLSQQTDYIDLIQKIDEYVKENKLKENNIIYPDEHLKRLLQIEGPFRYSDLKGLLHRENRCIYCNEFISNKFTHNKSKKHVLHKEIYELKQQIKEKDIRLESLDSILKNQYTKTNCCIPWFKN
jgi:hypothetical protein